MTSLNSFPDDILINIFSFVENKTLRHVCQKWRNIIKIEQIHFHLGSKLTFTNCHVRDNKYGIIFCFHIFAVFDGLAIFHQIFDH